MQTVLFGSDVAFALWWFGCPMVVWLTAFFSTFGNLVHRWAHMPKRQLPRWIRGMQEFGIFISQDHHEAHHKSMDRLIPRHEARKKFCPMTDWVNPVIDTFFVWQIFESALAVFGLKPTNQRC